MKKYVVIYAFLFPFVSLSQVDLSIDSTYQMTGSGGFYPQGLEYYYSFTNHLVEQEYSAKVCNVGTSDANNVVLNIQIDHLASPVFNATSDTIDIAAGTCDSIVIDTTYTPYLIGLNEIFYWVTSDSIDLNNSNDSVETFHELTDHPEYEVGRDNGIMSSSVNANTLTSNGWELGVVYEATQDLDIHGVSFFLDSVPNGSLVYSTLWKYNTDSSEFWWIDQTSDMTIYTSDSLSWITLCFYGNSHSMNAGDVFMISVGDYTSGVEIGLAQNAPDSSVFIWNYDSLDFIPLNNMSTPMIRWNQSAYCWYGLEEIEKELISFKIAPNPSNESTNIQYQLQTNAFVDLTITDMSGRRVRNESLGNQIKGKHEKLLDISDLNPGVYIVSLKAGDQQKTERLIISR